jgi:hypothetical protein
LRGVAGGFTLRNEPVDEETRLSTTSRYIRFADRVLDQAMRPFGVARARTAAIELIVVLVLLLALPAVANAVAAAA